MRARAALVLLASLFALMPPVLLVFSRPVAVFGVPVLYVWIFAIWPVLVALGARASRNLTD
jgi:hypothetical protein